MDRSTAAISTIRGTKPAGCVGVNEMPKIETDMPETQNFDNPKIIPNLLTAYKAAHDGIEALRQLFPYELRHFAPTDHTSLQEALLDFEDAYRLLYPIIREEGLAELPEELPVEARNVRDEA